MLRILISLLIFSFWQLNSYAQTERILNYHVDLEVIDDRSILVTENIKVYVGGDIIKRGITRYLPGKRSLNEKTVDMKYEILEVKKDGVKEPYHTGSRNGGLMLYLGEEDVLLPHGVYSYLIKYRVPHQIGFYEDYDEIYWNAIGHDVEFNVELASCNVQLPDGVVMLQNAAYVGRFGTTSDATKEDYTMELADGIFQYKTTRPLEPREGFTIAVGFEKGVFPPPSIFQRFGSLMTIIGGMLLLIPYYFRTWKKHGVDPPTPASYPIWDAPDGLSAASINYIQKGSYQNASFTGSVIDLAIKGYLKIEEVQKKSFFGKNKYFELVLLREPDDSLPAEEEQLMRNLFVSSDRVPIDGKYDSGIQSTYENHSASLSHQHRSFLTEGNNTRLIWKPILITLAIGALATIFLVRSPYMEGINLVTLIAFAPVAILGIILYAWLIKRPSEAKLDLRARIKGFKMYLQMAEKDRLNLLNPPEMTPEHFVAALPYAFA
ncbi:MAG: DUF2207 domain-containing protein, partial [Bacteroidia bacterium]|nr:DUF2207 domain-containing protein [Bacteroidia bacterium]